MNNPNKHPNKNKLSARNIMAAGAMALTSIGGVAAIIPSAGASEKTAYAQELTQLTKVITNLDNGGAATITSNRVELSGPTGEAEGQPIVFKVKEENGKNQTYFAFTQDGLPNFDQKEPIDTAANMAIVKKPTREHIELTKAHLNKAGELVGPKDEAVGFSVGGNSSGK